jgi:phosphoglucosamine mutase
MTIRAPIEFGTDGIRGVAGEYPLDPVTVLTIGRAIGAWLRGKTSQAGMDGFRQVVLGRDTRISGHMLARALSTGLLAEGIHVLDAGVLTTPGVAYIAQQGSYDLGIMISASHNPFEQNGIKIFGPDGFKLDDSGEEAIEALIASLPIDSPVRGLASANEHDPHDQYVSHLTGFGSVRGLDRLRVVLDCANGAAFAIAPDAFFRDGAQVFVLNAEPDGVNINVAAGSEQVRRDRSTLLAAMRENEADLGIAFDGDADRVVFVTPEGMLVDGDHVLGILALSMKAAGSLTGDSVVATDMSNSGLEHFLKANGIALIRTKVGDRYVMERMRQGGFVLGGEQAGHVIILDSDHTVGDGVYVGLLVAAIVARNKREGGPTLHALASHIPRYPQVIASAHLARQVNLAEVTGLDALIRETLDQFEGKGRVNVRFSGTEPNLLRAMVEGGPQTTLEEVIDRALALCGLVAQAAETPHPRIDIVDCVTGAPVRR